LVVKKGSKMRSRTSAGTPGPLSATRSQTLSRAGRRPGARAGLDAQPARAGRHQRLLRVDHQVQHTWPIWSASACTSGRRGQPQRHFDAAGAQRVAQQVGRGPHQVVQRTGARCGRPLRAMFRKVRTMRPQRSAASRMRTRVVVQRRALGLVLQQAGAAHHDGQRVVQLVRHAGQQAAHRGELLALAQRLALALDLSTRRPAMRSSAGTLTATRCRGAMKSVATRPSAARAAAEHGLGGGVPFDDARAAVDGDDGHQRLVDHGRLEGLAAPFALARLALRLEGVRHHARPGQPALAQSVGSGVARRRSARRGSP
jgi:hypothetical protein